VTVRGLGPEQLVDRARAGDRRAVGRLLSLVEDAGDEALRIAELTRGSGGGATVVGITGPPGAGKSTLVAAIVAALVEGGARPAVLAVDPSSPLTGGAILGDRVRMAAIDDTAFIRSLATRGHAGGLALSIPGAIRVLEVAGYAPVIVETVGVGQVEVEISATADTTVVVVTPGMGDAVQANKAGLLEVGDVFVVNKCDVAGATDTRRDLELMLDLGHVSGSEDAGYRPPIIMTNALDGSGVAAVVEAIAEHGRHLDRTGRRSIRRARRAEHEITGRVAAFLDARVVEALAGPEQRRLVNAVAEGTVSAVRAAEAVIDAILARPSDTALVSTHLREGKNP
jgi:LAO/AO transport system kinase